MGMINKYRLSLKFSEKDQDQTEVVNLLKQMGRRKSSFITKAVKYYLEHEPEAQIPMPKTKDVDREQMKKLLRELLQEISFTEEARQTGTDKNTDTPPVRIQVKEEKKPHEEPGDAEYTIEEDDMDDFLAGLEDW